MNKVIDRKKVKEFVDKGLYDYQIAEKLNCSTPCIANIRNRELKIKSKYHYKNIKDKIYFEYKIKHKSFQEISIENNIPLEKVTYYIGKHIMKLCRENKDCSYKALLPETQV